MAAARYGFVIYACRTSIKNRRQIAGWSAQDPRRRRRAASLRNAVWTNRIVVSGPKAVAWGGRMLVARGGFGSGTAVEREKTEVRRQNTEDRNCKRCGDILLTSGF